MDEHSILNDALQIRDPSRRAEYLAEACGRDRALRGRVEALLASRGEAIPFPGCTPIHADRSGATTTFDRDPSQCDDIAESLRGLLGRTERPNGLGTLGPYEVIGLIGRGAMGAVFRAFDTKLNRTVAVKVLAPELAAHPTARQRFPREAKAAAAVVHPHVVTIHAVGEERDLPYLVMEYVDGVSLQYKVREGPLRLDDILRIGSQIADGLAAAHRHGLVHRDIKPANILVENGDQRVKITDFGLARAIDDPILTRPGEIPGTPMFMSPEQAAGDPIDHRTDLFSLGSVLYAMCTGRPPFLADSAIAVMLRVRDGAPIPIGELNPSVPDWLIGIVDRLLEKNPDARFQTACEVSDLLREHLEELQYRGRSRGNGYGSRVPEAPGRRTPPPEPGPQPRESPPGKVGAASPRTKTTGPYSTPPSLDQFLIASSRIHRGNLDEIVNRLSNEKGPPDAARMAEELVRIGVLTRYQAAALYQGKGEGLVVGPYLVLERTESGGTAAVFKALHRELRAVVALKGIPLSPGRADRAAIRQFQREAEALARIHHPNIIRSLEHLQQPNGVYYHVTEYVEGRDLKFHVETSGVFPVAQAIQCVLQTAKGLQSAHSLQIIHRDIKPANLLLDNTGIVRILDFGLARVGLADPWRPDDGDAVSSRVLLETIAYLSPEQATDARTADARSDIYSLACTLHFLLTGRPPYTGRTWSEIYLAHRHARIPSLKALLPSVPEFLDDLFIRMLAKDPADRPRTVASIIASIELAMARIPASPPATQAIIVRRHGELDRAPTVGLGDVKIESAARVRRKETYYTGRRIRPPDEPWDTGVLVRYLLLTVALVVALIVFIELLR